MTRVVVPVGLDLGAIFAEQGPEDRRPSWYEVHLGGVAQQLTGKQYAAWLAAFDQAADGQSATPDPVQQELLERRLLLDYDTADIGPDVFAGLRLLPRAHGLGRAAGAPERFRIGDPGRPLIEVDAVVYQLWALAPTYPTLGQAFADFAEAGDWELAPGQARPTAAEVGARLAEVLPTLLRVGAAFLDPVSPAPAAPQRATPPDPAPERATGTTSRTHEPAIVPVGQNLGRNTGPDPDSWLVRHGSAWVELAPDERSVFLTAYDRKDLVADSRLNRHTLAEAARSVGVARPEPVIDDLLGRGLLLELDPDGLEQQFGRLHLFPLGRGFGNSAAQPGAYWIGRDRPEIGVGAEVYSLWSYACTAPSLWDACRTLAGGLDEELLAGDEPFGYSAAELAAMITPVLPALVVSGCALLDPLP